MTSENSRPVPTNRKTTSASSQSADSPSSAEKKPAKKRVDRGRLWIRDGDFVRPIDVIVGATDGSQTEVSGPAVSEGMDVVIGEARKEDLADGDPTNPFVPKIRPSQKKPQP